MPLLSKFKTQQIIILDPEVKPPVWPFSFGAAKAKVIMDRIGDIEKWYNTLPSGPSTDGKPVQLDITPEINQGKRFILDKYKAKLIIKYKAQIAEFIERVEMDVQRKHDDSRVKKNNMYLRNKLR